MPNQARGKAVRKPAELRRKPPQARRRQRPHQQRRKLKHSWQSGRNPYYRERQTPSFSSRKISGYRSRTQHSNHYRTNYNYADQTKREYPSYLTEKRFPSSRPQKREHSYRSRFQRYERERVFDKRLEQSNRFLRERVRFRQPYEQSRRTERKSNIRLTFGLKTLRILLSAVREIFRIKSFGRVNLRYFMQGLRFAAKIAREKAKITERNIRFRKERAPEKSKKKSLRAKRLAKKRLEEVRAAKRAKERHLEKKRLARKQAALKLRREKSVYREKIGKTEIVFIFEDNKVDLVVDKKAPEEKLQLAKVLIEVGKITSMQSASPPTPIDIPARETAQKYVLASYAYSLTGSADFVAEVLPHFQEIKSTYQQKAKTENISWGAFVEKTIIGQVELTATKDQETLPTPTVLKIVSPEKEAAAFSTAFELGKFIQQAPPETAAAISHYLTTLPIKQRTEAANQVLEKVSDVQELEYFYQACATLEPEILFDLISFATSAVPPKQEAVPHSNVLPFKGQTPITPATTSIAPIEIIVVIGKQVIKIKSALASKKPENLAEVIYDFINQEYPLPPVLNFELKSSALASVLIESGPEAIPIILEAYEIISAAPLAAAKRENIKTIIIEAMVKVAYVARNLEIVRMLIDLPVINKTSREVVLETLLSMARLESEEVIPVLIDSFLNKTESKAAPANEIEAEVLANLENSLVYLLERTIVLSQGKEAPQDPAQNTNNKAAAIEGIITKILAPLTNLSKLIQILQTNPDIVAKLPSQITDKLLAYFINTTSLVSEKIEEDHPTLFATSTSHPQSIPIQKALTDLPPTTKVAILTTIAKLLNIETNINIPQKTIMEQARKELSKLEEIVRAANLKLSFINFIRGYIYAGILPESTSSARSNLSAEMESESTTSKSTTNLKIVPSIAKEGTNSDLLKDGFEGPLAPTHESEFFVCGIIHRMVESQKIKAAKIIRTLQNNGEVWQTLLSHIENQQPERVSQFVEQFIREARRITRPKNLQAGKHVYSPAVLETALANITSQPAAIAA